MKIYALIALIIGSGCPFGFSQGLDKTKLDSYFDALEKNNKFMGSVAISQNGNSIYKRYVGYLDVGTEKSADENTKYRIGSITKTFTATLVMKAMEDGKLSLTQTIDTYFPSIGNSAEITISNLLNHRSGIHNFTSNKDYLAWATQPKTEEEMVKIISASGSDFGPDSKAEYSNSNYVLLTYILEKTYKKPYAELLHKYVTHPLKLTDTYYGKKIETTKNEANSYSFKSGWVKEMETDSSIPLGAGAIVSTPSDIIKFGEALFAGKIIQQQYVGLMKTITDGYGSGLFQFPFEEKKAFGHTGGIDGFSSMWGYFPEDNISFAVTSNGNDMVTNNIAIAVLSAVYNRPYEIPQLSTYGVSPDALAQYVGVYTSAQLPLKLTITTDGTVLIAQGTGQPPFTLEATGKDTFKFDKAGIALEFNLMEKTMILKQGGGTFNFTKE